MPFRILSLDGGGIRGIVTARMLAQIEKQIKTPLTQYFHLIAGTSTGSILASAIATGRRSEEIVEVYRQKSSRIFPYQSRFSLKRIPLILKYGVSSPKFSDTGLIQVMKESFGNARLFDLTEPRLLVIAYDTILRRPIIFKSWRQDKGYGNVPLWEVCVCSASAPTYFPAHQLERRVFGGVVDAYSQAIALDENASATNDVYNNTQIRITDGTGSGQIRRIVRYDGAKRQAWLDEAWEQIPDRTSSYSIKCFYSAIDGGVVANNPSSCAVAEALKFGYKPEEIKVLSIGTGTRTRVIPFKKAQSWGLVQWAQPIVGVLFDASEGIFEYITEQMTQNQLLRLQFQLDRQLTGKRLSDDIDDVSEENISNLLEAADIYMKQSKVQAALSKFLET